MDAIYPIDGLEIRADGGRMRISGRFAYRDHGYDGRPGPRPQGTVRAGRVPVRRRGRGARHPSAYAGIPSMRRLPRKRSGSLVLVGFAADGLTFERRPCPNRTINRRSWQDTVRMIRAGLVGGISPGFRVPPRDVVPDAETIEPEAGQPWRGRIRVINQAVLFELSLVTRPAYPDTSKLTCGRGSRRRRPGGGGLWL